MFRPKASPIRPSLGAGTMLISENDFSTPSDASVGIRRANQPATKLFIVVTVIG
jgi:hypothetical protein